MDKFDISSIDTLILCGGQGTRLRSVVTDKPKILVEIQNRPFIGHMLNKLEYHGIKNVVLCTGYMHNLIEEWVSLSYTGGLKIICSQELKPLGTAGAIQNARDFILSKYFFVINGDTYSDISYNDFISDFIKKKSFGSVAITNAKNTSDYGSIIFDRFGRLLSFKEKSKKNINSYINLGVYIFKRNIINHIANGAKVSLEKELIPKILKQKNKPIFTFKHQGLFFDFGTPERYKELNKIKLNLEKI